jgi:YggT family protein
VRFRTRSLPRSPRLGYQLGSYPSVKDPRVLFYTLFEIVGYLISIVVMLVIVQFVLSLLIAFNVVNTTNNFVSAIWQAVNALLDPILQPIRRIMPNTGAIDFSPMVLIVGLEVIRIILRNLAVAAI